MKSAHVLFGAMLTVAVGCGSGEFVAQESDLAGFTGWTKVTGPISGTGPNASAIGPAHDSGDASISRTIYINNNATRAADGQFPIGTILVKGHTKAGAMIGGTAMAKRGGSFNPSAKGWEWFVLTASGSVMARGGAEVMAGACNGCHNTAATKDLVFTR